MITVTKSAKFWSDKCCLHHVIGTDRQGELLRHVTPDTNFFAWAIALFQNTNAKTTYFYQSEENGINYAKKITNSFLKTTHSSAQLSLVLQTDEIKLSSYLLENLTLTSRGGEWSFKNHESGKIFVEFQNFTGLTVLFFFWHLRASVLKP